MHYVHNAWYAAGWSDQVGQGLSTRTLLDVPLLFFRDAGRVIAMHDQCPHRFAPLSRGALIDGQIRCGYHGLSFDTAGQCVRSLFSAVAPKAARVRTFVTHEQDKMVWVWMGEEAHPDTSKIPRLAFHTDSQIKVEYGYTHAKADYRLLIDNLMDLTHTAMLHPAFGGLDYLPAYKSREENDEVISEYIIERMPSFLDPTGTSFLHNHDKIRWTAPATHYLESRMTPEGSDAPIFIPSAHILTPETSSTTHYFWSSAVPPGTAEDAKAMREILIQAFEREDKPMVEAVQQRMGKCDLWDMGPVLLQTDAGSVKVRRRIAALVAAEKGSAPGRSD